MKPQIVFFGTGPVSLASLEGIADHFEIEAIITKPDRVRPSGRAHDHPVKAWAVERGLPVHQVAGKAELSELFREKQFESRAGLVVDFGLIINEDVIETFELGIINSHFSLLPLLRGADPITFVILEGHIQTGVSLMKIVPALDEGDLIAQEKIDVGGQVTTPELTDALVKLSNQMMISTFPHYFSGSITPWPQDPTIEPTYTRMLTKQDGVVDWTKPAVQLEREIRAYIGWPGSRTQLYGREVTITQARLAPSIEAGSLGPGQPHPLGDELLVGTERGTLAIKRLKPSGKREMSAADWLRGLKQA